MGRFGFLSVDPRLHDAQLPSCGSPELKTFGEFALSNPAPDCGFSKLEPCGDLSDGKDWVRPHRPRDGRAGGVDCGGFCDAHLISPIYFLSNGRLHKQAF